MISRRLVSSIIAFAVMALTAPFAWAEPKEPMWLSYADQQYEPPAKQAAAENAPTTLEPSTEPAEWEKPLPISLTLQYTLVSDYIFRGINYSEYPHEGRERPNHQLLTTISLDLAPLWGRPKGEYGEIGFDGWFEWFSGQKAINPTTGENIQEIDYTVWYQYTVEKLATDVKLGWVDYTYPNVVDVGDDDRTNEWFICLTNNDAWAWRGLGYQGKEGILNPCLSFYQDMHTNRGCWADLGINHPFEIIKNLTFTPSYTLSIDFGWMGALAKDLHGCDNHDTRIAGMTYGMDLTYDLTELLHLPVQAGKIAISGFLNWWDPTQQIRHYGPLLNTQDELYGGMKLTWSW
jgi:hypothetical protein